MLPKNISILHKQMTKVVISGQCINIKNMRNTIRKTHPVEHLYFVVILIIHIGTIWDINESK